MGWKAWTSAVHFICSSWLLLINFLSSSNLCCVVVKLACVEISIGHTSTHIILAFPFCPIMQLSTKKNKQKYLLFYLFFFLGGGGFKRKEICSGKKKRFHSPLCQYYLLFTGLSLNRRRQIQSDPKLNSCFSKFRIIWNHSTVHTQFINMLKTNQF